MLFQPKPRLIARVNYKCGIKDSAHTGRVAGDKRFSLKAVSNSMGFVKTYPTISPGMHAGAFLRLCYD
jgi:hypothetical protein